VSAPGESRSSKALPLRRPLLIMGGLIGSWASVAVGISLCQPTTMISALVIIGMLAASAAVAMSVHRHVQTSQSEAAEPLQRLLAALAQHETEPDGKLRLPALPSAAPRQWSELYAGIERMLKRVDSALASQRRVSETLQSSNLKLSAEIEARESYLEKQSQRLQDAMTATLQAAEAKTRVLTNTSHEIRTPLNGIIGTTELLLRSRPLSDSQRGLLKTQLGAAEALLSLVDDILQLGRASNGLALQLVPFDVAVEARLVCGALQPLANSRQISLKTEVPRDLHAARIGDRARIRQIMMGLVGNALKFTERGSVVLEVADSEEYALIIRVRDTGIGIPADQLSRIFEPFYQIDSALSRRFSGTGLGLAIISEIVKAMDGRITVESTLGVGTTFCVLLPLEFADPSALAEMDEAPEVASAAPSDLRVLVVDDIEMNRELLELQVASLGAACVTAESGQRALDRLAAAEFDLLLLDCQMPDMDGYETAQTIRQRWPQRSLRIVAVTAHAQPGERERCLGSGMDDYVAKPLTMATLERLLAMQPASPDVGAPIT